ncbi:MAG: L-histidine N(alpha)-methyltransferase [Rhizobiales bacterium]|nr:L-histidine N(alpha)-methyltransferase [Hyphomicrobiales bacterium]NRB13181.1 L-histidine N(alpha)-methyltransferase [Hyphomicrobiales bacterium]
MDKRIINNIDLLTSALASLSAENKWLDSKWFYDPAGSVLFEDITKLPEYYPTRTEVKILTKNIDQLQAYIPDGAALVELGSGSSTKTRILLDRFHNLNAYLPLDISEEFLKQSANELAFDYPDLIVDPVVADFMVPFKFPENHVNSSKIAFFPGSTIGNLESDKAIQLLASIHEWNQVSAFIIGIDLIKDIDTLISAYDDAAGVTAAFNLNILHRMNREIGANFDLEKYKHEARWNVEQSRIEMHLVSLVAQIVNIGATKICFEAGESIHTENSHKYSQQSFAKIAAQSGWNISKFITDEDDFFAVAVLQPK